MLVRTTHFTAFVATLLMVALLGCSDELAASEDSDAVAAPATADADSARTPGFPGVVPPDADEPDTDAVADTGPSQADVQADVQKDVQADVQKDTGDVGPCSGLTAGAPCETTDCCVQNAVCETCEPGGAGCDQSGLACVSQSNPCDDGNECTANTCVCVDDSIECGNDAADDGTACTADSEFCTAGDTCQAGQCEAGAPVELSDDDPCTVDACINGRPTHEPSSGAACDDGNACTDEDHCQEGECVSDDAINCALPVCASAAECVPATGECIPTWSDEGATCDDGDPCTKGESCSADHSCGGGTQASECVEVKPGEVCAEALELQSGETFSADLCDYTDDAETPWCGAIGKEMIIKVWKGPESGNCSVIVSEWFDGMVLNLRGYDIEICESGAEYYCWNENDFSDPLNNPGFGYGGPEVDSLDWFYFMVSNSEGECGPFELKVQVNPNP